MNINIDHWVKFMISIGILNLLLVAYIFTNIKGKFELKIALLAGYFVLVNSIRSIWLRHDNNRTCIFDSIMSSPLLGRSITTFSELAFVLLVILITKQIINKDNHNPQLNIALNIIFVIIVVAEVFCWTGCLSHNQYWNMLEESSWTLSSIILIIVFAILYVNNTNKTISKFLYVAFLSCMVYITYMIKVDVPMYYKRGDSNLTEEYKKKTLLQKVYDMYKCKRISKSNEDWDEEIPWMTSYFTFGSWLSLGLVFWYQNNRKLFK